MFAQLLPIDISSEAEIIKARDTAHLPCKIQQFRVGQDANDPALFPNAHILMERTVKPLEKFSHVPFELYRSPGISVGKKARRGKKSLPGLTPPVTIFFRMSWNNTE